jgi:predicted RNase H-like nuclease (RuvC/YqgF family)
MEAEHANLVSQETVEKYQTKISDLQNQLRLKEETHRSLIQRYSLLKSVIEHAFQKNNNNNDIQSQQSWLKHVSSNCK